MLQLFSTGLIPMWLNLVGVTSHPTLTPLSMFDLLRLTPPDTAITEIWQASLHRFSSQGFQPTAQGFWLQTSDRLLVNHNAQQPLPAASLTKVATTLAALKTWGPHHTFQTDIRTTGPIVNGMLQGDLVIVGGGDPLFVGHEAISLGYSLNQLGIQAVSGNLVISGNFWMDFLTQPLPAGERLRQGLNGQIYPTTEESRYTPPASPTFTTNLAISGTVQWRPSPPPSKLILRHHSLPVFALLKQMNVNSNNPLAESLASAIGNGPALVARVATATGIPADEIRLQNGSGLGQENRLSPRAVVAMLQGIQEELQVHQLTLADVFPVSKRDLGTIEERQLPTATIVKTGTLWNVSALAGVVPTQRLGPVWFTIINRGENIEGFRQDQDHILQQLTQRLGTNASLTALKPSRPMPALGDPNRNLIPSQD